MLYKLATTDRIVIYKKDFTLAKGLTFKRYIKALDKENFSPFILYIENTPLFNSCHLEFQFAWPVIMTPFTPAIVKPFSERILLDDCLLRYAKNKRDFTLEVSINIWWILFYVLLGIILFVVPNTIILLALLLFLIIPHFIITIAILNRDIKRFEKIVSLGLKPIK